MVVGVPHIVRNPGALNDNYIGEPLSIDELNTSVAGVSVMCYPNPFADKAEIRWRQSVAADVRVELFSSQGQILADMVSHHYADGEHSVDITNLVNWQQGLYFAKITIDGSRPIVIKILRQ